MRLKINIVAKGHEQNIKVNCEKIFVLYVSEYNATFFEKSLKFKNHR